MTRSRNAHAPQTLGLVFWCGWICALAGCVGNRGGGPLVLRSPIARRDRVMTHDLSRLGEVDPLPAPELPEPLAVDPQERQGSSLAGLEKKAGVSNETWDAVLTELQTLAVVAPQEHARLVEDLRATDPSVWPTLLEYSRVALSRQRRGSIASDTPAPMRATNRHVTAAVDPLRAAAAGGEATMPAAEGPPVGATIRASGLPALADVPPTAVAATAEAPPASAPPTNTIAASAPLAAPTTGGTGVTSAAVAAPTVRTEPVPAASAPLAAPTTGVDPMAPTVAPVAGIAADPPATVSTAEPERLATQVGGAQPLAPSPNALAPQVAGGAGNASTGVLPAGFQTPASLADGGGLPAPAGDAATAATSAAAVKQATWQAHLDGAIRALEGQTAEVPGTAAAQLPMLYLAAGRRDEALEKARGLETSQQAFWLSELYGLASYLDAERTPDAATRATEAATHLAEAQATLAESALLQVRNLSFCTRVDGFGVLKPFERMEFSPGQRVLLYAELDHFKSEATPEGFHTAFRCHYEIFDAQGRRVAQHQFELTEERCRNRRRDFFICFDFHLPEQQIYDGRHTLKLTVEDTLANKVGQGSIDFEFRRAGAAPAAAARP